MKKSAWVIGASQGIGLEVARVLKNRDWQVIISARNEDQLNSAARQLDVLAVPFDATDKSATEESSRKVYDQASPDVVLVNVGDYEPMPLSEFKIDVFERLNRTNYLSCVYILGTLIPKMREEGGGQIILNASAAGYRGLPNSAPYSSPKAALIHMAECLAPELAKENIELKIVNHGFVKSRLTQKNSFSMPFLMEAKDAATRIANAISTSSFEIAFPKRLIYPMKVLRCLPYKIYFGIVNRWILQ